LTERVRAGGWAAPGRRTLLVAGMLLVALNLRAALASVGPLVDFVMDATGMSATAFGSLTTLPLLAFGVISPLAPSVIRRLGLGAALIVALLLILLGTATRPLAGATLLFLVLRARDTHMATRLSGMAQSIGYFVAAVGPALIGLVRDLTGSWTVPLLCLFAVLAAKVVSGIGAARDRVIAVR